MSRTVTKVLWCISGLLLIAAGIVVMIYPVDTLFSLAIFLSIAMLVDGISNIVAFVQFHALPGTSWLLADGILTVLLAILLFFARGVTAAVLPFIFGIWIMVSGILRIVNSTELKKLGFTKWGWMLAIGIIGTIFGVVSIIIPEVATVAISIFLGVLFILQGIMAISLCFTTRIRI